MVNFGDGLKEGISFCLDPKRWLPLYTLDVAIVSVFAVSFLAHISTLLPLFTQSGFGTFQALSLAGFILGFIILGVIWFILRNWIIGSLIHQSYRNKEIERSYTISLSRLPKLIVTAIIIAIISAILGTLLATLPFVGIIINIIISLIFFYVMQGIIIDDIGAVNTLKASYRFFRKAPFDVFIIWLLIAIIAGLITLAFSIPLLSMFFGAIFGMAVTSASAVVGSGGAIMFFLFLQERITTVFAFALIAVLGMDIAQTFSIRAQTDFYMQFKKSYPSILKSFAKDKGRFF